MQPSTRKSALTLVAVLNNTGSLIPAKLGVKKGAVKNEIALPAATTEPVWGVTIEPIADGEWGTMQTGPGKAIMTSGAALATPGTMLTVDTAGKAVAFSAGGGVNANVIGSQNTTTAGADEDLEVELAGPFTLHQG